MAQGHRITVEPSDRHVRVVHGDRVLAESERTLLLRETGCPDRYYVWAYPDPKPEVQEIKDHLCFYDSEVS